MRLLIGYRQGVESKSTSDSAAYDQTVLDHWENRHWEFAVSAEMHQGLKQEMSNYGNDWHLWKMEKGG